MFLDKKTLLKIWLNPGLNLTIFRGNGPWRIFCFYPAFSLRPWSLSDVNFKYSGYIEFTRRFKFVKEKKTYNTAFVLNDPIL